MADTKGKPAEMTDTRIQNVVGPRVSTGVAAGRDRHFQYTDGRNDSAVGSITWNYRAGSTPESAYDPAECEDAPGRFFDVGSG